jgi:hypothetical protein
MKPLDTLEFYCRFDPENPDVRHWAWRCRNSEGAISLHSRTFESFLAAYGNALAHGFSGGGFGLTAEPAGRNPVPEPA